MSGGQPGQKSDIDLALDDLQRDAEALVGCVHALRILSRLDLGDTVGEFALLRGMSRTAEQSSQFGASLDAFNTARKKTYETPK